MSFEKVLKDKGLYDIFNKFIEKKTLKEVVGKYAYIYNGNKYSFRNVILAWSQADILGLDFQGSMKGFNQWKKDKVYINGGSKGLKILIPCIKEDQLDKEYKNKGWIPENDTQVYYITGSVFDVCQTSDYKKDKEELDKIIYGNPGEIPYNLVFDFVSKTTRDIKINKDNDAKGHYNTINKEIVLKEENGNTLLHEFGHYLTYDLIDKKEKDKYAKDEILAEITAYLIKCKLGYNNINTNYSNVWSSRINELDIKGFYSKVEKIIKIIESKFKEAQNDKFNVLICDSIIEVLK